jgi:hypothetical protein
MSAGLEGLRGVWNEGEFVMDDDVDEEGVALWLWLLFVLWLGESRLAAAAALAASRSARVTGTWIPREGRESDLRRVL